MADVDLKAMWDARHREAQAIIPEAAWVLRENRHLLPSQGRALDLACGLGGNAFFLAETGLDTLAWDFSAVAIDKLNEAAAASGLSIASEARDVIKRPPEPESFDVIVVSRFLDRSLAPVLQAALRPAGLLFYQTWTRLKGADQGPSNPAFLLDENELLHLFHLLTVRVYREEGLCGDIGRGLRNMAMLVAQKA